MKMYPPALINKDVTEAMLHWMMMHPNTVTMNLIATNEFNITPAKGAQDFPIDDRTKEFMLFELQRILEFNGFRSELLANGNLRVSKDYWQMDVEKIHDLLPFPDHLPYQIEQAYKHRHQNNLHSSQEVKVPRYDYPTRERLESIGQTIIGKMEGDA